MALDLEDQEQLDEFKVWWNKYGKLTINVVLVLLVAYAAWQGYQYYQHKKAVEASDIYQNMVQLDPSNIDLIKSDGAKLMNDYADSPYAGRAAILLAKNNFKANDIESTKSQLNWAVSNAKETPVKAVASLQLATILLDEKDYSGAEKLLTTEIDPGYIGLKDNLLGDIYMAQGKAEQAKKAFQSAVENLEPDSRLSLFAQQKLDSLGS